MSALEKIYAAVTNEIVKALEAGTVPWNKPWSGKDAALNSKGKPYRGYNQMILSFVKGMRKYTSNVWLTWKQIEALGGKVKAENTKDHFNVIFYNWLDDKKNPGKKIPFLRYYRVYNFDATENVKLPASTIEATTVKNPLEFSPIESCEAIIAGYKDAPTFVNRDEQAYYRPSTDEINMPKRESFRSVEDFYSVLFHEINHSTGAEKRLNRKTLTEMAPFGSAIYSEEELVAEMGAAMLCGVAGIGNKVINQSAAYCAGWLRKIKNEPGILIKAAGKAQKSCDYVLGVTFAKEEEAE